MNRERRRLLLAMLAVAAFPACAAERRHRAAPPAEPIVLPDRLLGIYWSRWTDTPHVGEIMRDAPQYNLLYAAFATPNGNRLAFSPDASGDDRFIGDLSAWKKSGRVVLISIGGGGNDVKLRDHQDVEQAARSLTAIVEKYGFQGIDWDIERGDWHAESVVRVSREMKQRFGNAFIVSIVPRPYEMRAGGIYREVAHKLGDMLDLVGLQFYDYPESRIDHMQRSIIRNDIADFVSVVPASKLLIGAEAPGGGDNWSPTTTYRDAFAELLRQHPDIRGAFIWDSPMERRNAYEFARMLGPLVRERLDKRY